MLDLLFQNATIVDGTDAPAFTGDVGVEAGRIRLPAPSAGAQTTAPGADASAARRTVACAGLMLAPGFIDIHAHPDIALLARPGHSEKLTQGVTTEVFSNCGLGFAPVSDAGTMDTQRRYLQGLFGDSGGVDWGWRSVDDYLNRLDGTVAVNSAYLIPHGALRASVMQMEEREATPAEVDRMAGLARDAMRQGARGLSCGLFYAPMCYAARDETVAICKAVAEFDGIFAIHMREYGNGILESLEESVAISRESGAPLQVSHLQITGSHFKGEGGRVLAALDAARRDGLDVTLDCYPYLAGSTLIQALLPHWANAGGPDALRDRLRAPAERARMEEALALLDRDFSLVHLCGLRTERNQPLEGVTVTDAAARRGRRVPELLLDLLVEEDLQACFIAHQCVESDLQQVLQHPGTTIGSDGLHLPGHTHPRLFGTFPRVLSRYVRELGTLSMEEAVHKMTGASAARLGLSDRGVIRDGAAADLVLFDPVAVQDNATYETPRQHASGIEMVVVNGRIACEAGQPTGARAGRALRRASTAQRT